MHRRHEVLELRVSQKRRSCLINSVLRSLGFALRLAQIHQPCSTVELSDCLSDLVLLLSCTEAATLHISCWCSGQDGHTLDLIWLLLREPSHDDCVACVPGVEDFEGDWWLIALAVKELLLVCEGVRAELFV